MFQMKLAIFAQEIVSVILTPFILFFSLPPCAGKIIDFCREFTVHVSGIGYVCSFAVFDFKREGNVKASLSEVDLASSNTIDCQVDGAADQSTASRLMAQENKMEQSFLHFKITNPEWQPSDPASMLLSRIADGEINSQRLKSPFRLRNGILSPTQLGSSRTAKLHGDVPIAGGEEDRLKQRSMVYEAALQRSLLLRSGATGSRMAPTGRSSRLQPMQEAPEVEDEDGWETAKLGERLHDQDQLQASAEGDAGPGMLGLIHQVIKK